MEKQSRYQIRAKVDESGATGPVLPQRVPCFLSRVALPRLRLSCHGRGSRKLSPISFPLRKSICYSLCQMNFLFSKLVEALHMNEGSVFHEE